MFAAFELLSELQNNFLREVMNVAAKGCSALLYLKSGEHETIIRATPLLEIKDTGIPPSHWICSRN